METGSLKRALIFSCSLSLAVSAANAASPEKAKQPFADADHVIYTPLRETPTPPFSLNKADLTNHGGGVLSNPHVVFLFWGPSFCSGGADVSYASTLQAYRNQFGSTGEWKVINQYGIVFPANLGGGTPDGFDCSTPPTNVTDATVQSHINGYLSTHTFDNMAVYQVVIPRTSYSSSGSSTSCGGPSLAYCTYYGHYTSGTHTVIYSIQPWVGCTGCQRVSGWTTVLNQETFVWRNTREAVVNPVNGWWDSTTGQGVDGKCAVAFMPFLDNGYAYEWAWSNADKACVKAK